MKRMYMLTSTIFDGIQLDAGDTYDVTDEDAERWQMRGIARLATAEDPGPETETPERSGDVPEESENVTVEPMADDAAQASDQADGSDFATERAVENQEPGAPASELEPAGDVDAGTPGDDEPPVAS